MVKRKSYLIPAIILFLALAVNPFGVTPGSESVKAGTTSPATDEELVRQFVSERDLEEAFIGVAVRNLKTGKTVLNYNGKKYFTPASNQKLLTTWAGLKELGPEFRYETGVYVEKGANLEKKRINSGLLV